MQELVDRRFYRRKTTPQRRLRPSPPGYERKTDLNALTDEMTSVVRGTMQPAHVSLWLHPIQRPTAPPSNSSGTRSRLAPPALFTGVGGETVRKGILRGWFCIVPNMRSAYQSDLSDAEWSY
jgi:hypothetical protein